MTRFQVGDEVFGDSLGCGHGGFAEYVRVPETAPFLPKPPELSFSEAAALPQAGVLALQGMRDQRKLSPGQRVLINGAGGGSGTFAIQLAKHFGVDVTAVDNAGKLELMASLGADRVIDYDRENFTRENLRYDLILDFAAHRSLLDVRRALAADGVYALVGGSMSSLLQALFLGTWFSKTTDRKMGILASHQNRDELSALLSLLKAGAVAPVIDRHYALSEVPEAQQTLGEGRARGKLVVLVNPERSSQ